MNVLISLSNNLIVSLCECSISRPVGMGLNFLLLRKDEYDLYGRWVVCRVRNSPLSSKRYRDIEPFGFCDQKEIQEIEKADRALHVYTVTFNDKIQESFLEVVLFAMRRTK